MSGAEQRSPAVHTLAEYLVRYDLATVLAHAQQEYDRPTAVTPRLLDQSEIAARFRPGVAPKPRTK